MARFQAGHPNGVAVQELEVLVRTAIFKPANALVAFLLQAAADRIDAAYQPKPGEQRKGREHITAQGIFGSFPLQRDYYYHPGKKQGHYPADAALGLEGAHTPALARLVCLEGADESSYQKAENHLQETGGIPISARQIQRLAQQVGAAAQTWQKREALTPQPGTEAAPIMYLGGDGSGVPMRQEELEGRAGKQPDGGSKTRMAYLGCVFTQHKQDEEGHPIRDHDSTTYVSTFSSIDEFGPLLRQEAIRRGLALALQVVLLIDGATGLANMGRLCFPTATQIVDFYHALEHAGKVLVALLGSKEHPDYKKRLGRWARGLLKDPRGKTHCPNPPRMRRSISRGGGGKGIRLLRQQREPDAIWDFPQQGFLHWFRRHRSRVQDSHWRPLQTIGHVLGQTGRRKHPGLALHPRQSPP